MRSRATSTERAPQVLGVASIPARRPRRRAALAVLALAGLGAAVRLCADRRTQPALHPPIHLAAAAAAIGLGALGGAKPADMGLEPKRALRGAAVGAVVGTAMVTPMVLASRQSTVRRRLVESAEALDTDSHLAGVTLLRIPLNTALYEESLFRAALESLLALTTSEGGAVVSSAAVFGVWHLPEVVLRAPESRPGESRGRAVEIAETLVATGSAGIVFSLLRRWTGTLAAPVVAHAIVNGVGHALAVRAWRANGAKV